MSALILLKYRRAEVILYFYLIFIVIFCVFGIQTEDKAPLASMFLYIIYKVYYITWTRNEAIHI